MEIELDRRFVTRVLGITTAVLVAVHLALYLGEALIFKGHLHRLVRLFNLSNEANVPTYFSSMLLLVPAVLLMVIGIVKRRDHAAFARHWQFLGFIFLCLSLDETACIHESLIGPLRSMLHATGVFYFTWVIPAVILVFIVGLTYLRFILALPRVTRNLTIRNCLASYPLGWGKGGLRICGERSWRLM